MNKSMDFDLFDCLSETEKKQGKLRGVISAAIENKRFELNMTQNEFAKKIGVTQGMVSKLESSEYNITVDKMIELFEKLDIEYNININGEMCVNNICTEFGGKAYLSPKFLNFPEKSHDKFSKFECIA